MPTFRAGLFMMRTNRDSYSLGVLILRADENAARVELPSMEQASAWRVISNCLRHSYLLALIRILTT